MVFQVLTHSTEVQNSHRIQFVCNLHKTYSFQYYLTMEPLVWKTIEPVSEEEVLEPTIVMFFKLPTIRTAMVLMFAISERIASYSRAPGPCRHSGRALDMQDWRHVGVIGRSCRLELPNGDWRQISSVFQILWPGMEAKFVYVPVDTIAKRHLHRCVFLSSLWLVPIASKFCYRGPIPIKNCGK